jgi:hypothetical protein
MQLHIVNFKILIIVTYLYTTDSVSQHASLLKPVITYITLTCNDFKWKYSYARAMWLSFLGNLMNSIPEAASESKQHVYLRIT